MSEQRQVFAKHASLFDWEDSNHVMTLLFRSRLFVVLVVPCTPLMSHLRCAEHFYMCLACGYLETTISTNLSQTEFVFALAVVECVVAHGPEMRFMCLFFLYVSETATLTSCCFLDC